MSKFLFIILLLPIFLIACAKQNTTIVTHKEIVVGKGPEDILIDSSTGRPRLIISCGDFKNSKDIKREGGIYGYDFQSGDTLSFKTDLPKTIQLIPHGISLLPGDPSLLYVINHTLNDEKKHKVLVFRIEQNELNLVDTITSEKYLTSPNDLTVLPDGSFYFTNTGPFTGGSFFKRIFTSLSNITYYNASNKSFKIVYDKIGVANGIQAIDNKLYVANSFTNKLYEFSKASDGVLTLNEKIKIVKQMDNLSFDADDNKLYIASHDSALKFMRSRKKGKSPFTIYTLNLLSHKVEKVMHNDGALISGVSTAVFYDGHLYLSQVFGNYLLKITLK